MSIPAFTQFFTGEILTATVLNQFPTAAVASFGAIDRTNMGPNGIDASSIIPTTAPAATFGGTQTYAFPKLVSSQGLIVAAGSTPGAAQYGISIGTPDGYFFNIPSGTTNGWRFGVNNASVPASITPSGSFQGGAYVTTGITAVASTMLAGNVGATAAAAFTTPVGTGGSQYQAGDLAGQHSTTVGCVWLGGSGTSYALDGGFNSAGNISLLKSGASIGTFNGTTGVYTASDARLKENIKPLSGGAEVIMALKPSTFTWAQRTIAADEKEHVLSTTEDQAGKDAVGFIAQEVQAVLPDAVLTMEDATGKLGVSQAAFIPYMVQMLQEQQAQIAALQAYVAAHP